jgi:uncharacterized protein (TIGR00369 family)
MEPDSVTYQKMLDRCRRWYDEKIPFNRVLGFSVASLDAGNVCVKFDMKPELIGNYVYGFLHGGVISAVLDATGGLTATIGMLTRLKGDELEQIEDRIARVGTIDLRVDYLRPGMGAHFTATSKIMRAGRKVTVTRMELHNDQDVLIAVGTGTYIVG